MDRAVDDQRLAWLQLLNLPFMNHQQRVHRGVIHSRDGERPRVEWFLDLRGQCHFLAEVDCQLVPETLVIHFVVGSGIEGVVGLLVTGNETRVRILKIHPGFVDALLSAAGHSKHRSWQYRKRRCLLCPCLSCCRAHHFLHWWNL
ncbi:hypothetical protein ASH00_12400 [Arthrobacter sp. Soil782]|nr:hypothetical protein ASH00_12400 [Arthrobacter sp. Soil782]